MLHVRPLPSTRHLRRLAAALLATSVAACSADAASPAGGAPDPTGGRVEPPPAPAPACSAAGQTTCEGPLLRTCEETASGLAWSPAVACPGDATCRGDACVLPTARQQEQAASIRALVEEMARTTAWHGAVDSAAVATREATAVLRGDGSDATFFGAAWRAVDAYPQGHQALYATAQTICGRTLPYQHASRLGVCGRPVAGGIVVTTARAGNRLGLARGDVVVRAGADAGDAIAPAAYLQPVCGGTYPSESGRRFSGAASFFGVVRPGTELTVRAPDGSTRTVTVPAESDTTITDCGETFGRSTRLYAEATTRPDGVAIIRLPSFTPFDKQLPAGATLEQARAAMAEYQAKIVEVFDTVKTARGIVWDVRGNTGGFTPVGLAIAGGFPSARTTAISYCRSRRRASSPVTFETERYATYDVTPGGPFAYAGKVAVVTDGLAYSAGDYFPRAVRRATDVPVVGAPTAGAYGGGAMPIDVQGPPALVAVVDPTACFDASDDAPMEAAPLPATIPAELSPADVAAGRDTVVERAVEAMGL